MTDGSSLGSLSPNFLESGSMLAFWTPESRVLYQIQQERNIQKVKIKNTRNTLFQLGLDEKEVIPEIMKEIMVGLCLTLGIPALYSIKVPSCTFKYKKQPSIKNTRKSYRG